VKGNPNRVTKDMRMVMSEFAENNAPKAQGWIDRIAVRQPARALTLWLRACEYVLPRLQSVGVELKKPDTDATAPPVTDAAVLADYHATRRLEASLPAPVPAPATISEPPVLGHVPRLERRARRQLVHLARLGRRTRWATLLMWRPTRLARGACLSQRHRRLVASCSAKNSGGACRPI
jgi:hypothetical protein